MTVTVAVRSSSFPDATAAQNALIQMKTALINHIGGKAARQLAT